MEWLKIIILGIIQGITEWLPISSTGHLLLFEHWVGLTMYEDPLVNADFFNLFLVVIQFGSILAIVYLFFKRLNPFDPRKTVKAKRSTIRLWIKLIIGCIPTAVIGLLLNDFIDRYFHTSFVIAVMLITYGIAFIVVENHPLPEKVHTLDQLSYGTAFKIGCAQTLAIVPGTSRSGATIVGSLLLGVNRTVATEFSFFLACPVMLGASLLKVFSYGAGITWIGWVAILLGTAVSFVVSLFAVKYLLYYIRKHDFKVFGYYRIILGLIVLLTVFF